MKKYNIIDIGLLNWIQRIIEIINQYISSRFSQASGKDKSSKHLQTFQQSKEDNWPRKEHQNDLVNQSFTTQANLTPRWIVKESSDVIEAVNISTFNQVTSGSINK